MMIPFNRPYVGGNEIANIKSVLDSRKLAGDYLYTEYCHKWLEANTGCNKALLTHSCTAALEMAAILLDIEPGDEIIMPSYTFVSTANAFVLRGGVPVFVDIRKDTLNIDETLIEGAITKRTKAIVPVHYAGVACEMDVILEIARRHRLMVVEDAAQGIGSNYKGRALGSMGDLGALSFHETKNIISGEGGTLLINNQELVERAEIIREKGTDRSKFVRKEVEKYTWVDIGSSYLPGEVTAAFLWTQLQEAEKINSQRIEVWGKYHTNFHQLEKSGVFNRPFVPDECQHNAHMYYLLLSDFDMRTLFIRNMEQRGVNCVFHYVPLHSSSAGKKYGRTHGDLVVTDEVSDRLVRLPLWVGLNVSQVSEQVKNSLGFFR